MSSSGTEFAQSQPGVKVLVLLGSPFLYGMERSVIELFDKLRPEVEPHFVLTQTAFRQQLPILREIESRVSASLTACATPGGSRCRLSAEISVC